MTHAAAIRRYIAAHPGCSSADIIAAGVVSERVDSKIHNDVKRGTIDVDVVDGVRRYWLQVEQPERYWRGQLRARVVELLSSQPMTCKQLQDETGRGKNNILSVLGALEREDVVYACPVSRPLLWILVGQRVTA